MSVTVDTVGFAFPIASGDEYGATAQVVGFGTEGEQVRWRRALPGGGFVAWGLGPSAWVEASLPKRVRADNVDGLPLDDVPRVVEELHSEACEYVEAVEGVTYVAREGVLVDGRNPRQAVLKRLDLVRDFDGVAVAPVLDGLATVPRSPSVKVRRFADAERAAAETLRVGVRSAWSTVLYDKHAESGGLAAPGRLRFEARLRSSFLVGSIARRLAGAGLAHVRSLGDAQALRALCRERFEFVGFDHKVAGTDAFAHALMAADLSPRVRRELLGYLAAEHLGIDLGMSSNTARKYRNLAASVGLRWGSVPWEVTTSLDFDAGAQVLDVLPGEHQHGDD